MLLTFYTFFGNFFTKVQFLILRSISFIEANKNLTFFLVILTYILGRIYLDSDISFFCNKDVLSEDFSILNASEGPSQQPGEGSGQVSGEGSGEGSGKGPGGGNDRTMHLSTVINPETDTDRLADHLQNFRGNGNQMVNTAGIHFGNSYNIHNFHDPQQSLIARYVNRTHPDIFNERNPSRTIISNNLILRIRRLRENVPAGFTYY
jgi:hypothetical protein